jgi:selenocysteine-specific translation elongation factor
MTTTKSLNVGVFNDAEMIRALGKKGTESDIIFSNRKDPDCVYTFMQPAEDKVIPKSEIAVSIDAAVVSFAQPNPGLGETILMLDAAGVKCGVVIVHPGTDVRQVVEMTKGTTLESFVVREKIETHIMETLSCAAPVRDNSSPASVVIDHSFSVKGVGEVVLGFVRQGTVKKFQKLLLLPGGKEVIVRSIQMHDKDYDEAPAGSRVGLCMKGAAVDEMRRGAVLAEPGACKVSQKVALSFAKNKFYRDGPKEGSFHVTAGMQTVPVKVSGVSEGGLTIEAQKPLVYSAGDTFLLMDLNAPKVHLIGHGKAQ